MRTIYRAYSESGALLYIGVTRNLKNRIKLHTYRSIWFFRVKTITYEVIRKRFYPDMAEVFAIWKENPIFNINHRSFLYGRICQFHKKRNIGMSYIKKLMENDRRGNEIVALYKRGMSMQKIGDKFSLSRQRISAIIAKRTTPKKITVKKHVR